MPTYNDKLEILRSHPGFKSLSPSEQRAALLQFDERERQSARAQKSAELIQARAQGGAPAEFVQRAFATTAGIGKTALLGYTPKLASMIPFAPSEPELQGTLDAYQEQFPASNATGEVAGNFVGPLSMLSGGVSRVVGGAAGRAIAPLVKPIESEFGRRLLTNLVSNAAGGAAAIGTYEAAKNQPGGIPERLGNAVYATGRTAGSLPMLAGLAVGSYAQTKLTRPPAADLAKAVDHYERLTGVKVPIETLTDSAELQSFYDAAARLPGMQDRIAGLRKQHIDGLQQYIADIGKRSGGAPGTRESLREGAARAVRTVIGSEGTPGGKPAPTTLSRRAQISAAIAQDQAKYGQQRISTMMLDHAVNAIRKTRQRFETSELEPVFDEIKALAKANQGLDASDLEYFRQQAGALGKFAKNPMTVGSARAGTNTDREVGLFYEAITDTARQSSPEYHTALGVSKALHRMEDALGDVPMVDINDEQAASFFRGFSRDRWSALVRDARPDDISGLKGWYYQHFLERVANPSGVITERRLRQVTGPRGPFNSQIMEQVLPGVLPEIREYSKLSTAMMTKGRFAAENSATFGRAARIAELGGMASMGSAIYMIGSSTNPFRTAVAVVTPIGMRVAVRAAIRSMIGGQLEKQMQRTVRAGPTPFGRSAVAANQQLQSLPQPIGTGPNLLTSLPGSSPAGDTNEGVSAP